MPDGSTTTYAALAEAIGLDRSHARHVGAALGRNQALIITACHRVLGTDGSLTGYAGGVTRKRSLLELEGRVAGTRLSMPQVAAAAVSAASRSPRWAGSVTPAR